MNPALKAFVDAELGQSYVSDWMEVDQALISGFADLTHDWNFIHVDPEAAAKTEYGGTIAHGFLVVSLLAPLRATLPRAAPPGLRMGVNYGIEKLRFVGPVPSGKRVRGHFTVAAFDEHGPDKLREEMDITIEVEGSERPAVVARWLTMYFF